MLRTGTDGTATFGFTVPRAATGDAVTVELVAWTAPIPVGTAGAASAATATTGGPVPTAVDAGDGTSVTLPSVPTLAALLALLAAVGTIRRNLTVRQH